MTISRAEHVALTLVSLLISGVTLPYLADNIGFGIQPVSSALGTLVVGAVVAFGLRQGVTSSPTALALLTIITAATAVYLSWIAWPSLLPPGAGPDLTHHLVLIDYLERHATLVHEPDATGQLGEMADYTPGVHLLAVLVGAVSRSHGFTAVYSVVAFAVALKVGVFFLTLLRLLAHHRHRTVLSLAGVGLVFHVATYSVDSFTRDSFLAQVVSETFAVVMWWAVVVWWQQPTRGAIVVFGAAGVAVFLTWPMWIGPPVFSFAAAISLRQGVAASTKARHIVAALAPIAVVALIHTLGRTAAVGIIGTSGAVAAPSLTRLGWWLPVVAAAGLASAAADRRVWPLGLFAATVALQAGALWWVARRSGADTPYMAIKMTYLGVYPLIAAAMLFISLLASKRVVAFAAAAIVAVIAIQDLSTTSRLTPIVSRDLWDAGRWARERIRPECLDYLVGNANTAYWLHLAVLGNRRASERSVNDDTFATQRAFERWLTDEGPPYAIANMAVLPADIRDRVRIVHHQGSAAVVQRLIPRTVPADDGCGESRPAAGL